MGLTLKLTDNDIPVSPPFVEFLYNELTGTEAEAAPWYRQETEELIRNKGRFDDINDMAAYVSHDETGRKAILMAYRLFKHMLTGDLEPVHRFIDQFHFFLVVGIPRTGGTYLTKQVFRACDIDYTRVQSDLAHDGYPDLSRFSRSGRGNAHTNGLLQLAEYLTMVEMFFKPHSRARVAGRIVVPKKMTKALYNFDLIDSVFGTRATYVLTVRHPLAMCKSLLDKSGGYPEGGRFAVRATIERWALNDWMRTGMTAEQVMQLPYEEVIFGYWKRYHYMMAMTGVPALPQTSTVVFGSEPMNEAAHKLFRLCQREDLEPETFVASEIGDFPGEVREKAAAAVEDVTRFWASLGMRFPALEG